MDIKITIEFRGTVVNVFADFEFGQKSLSNGDRFAEPDDVGFCNIEAITEIGTYREFDVDAITADEREKIEQAIADEAHEMAGGNEAEWDD